jgi:inner membrane protein
MTGKTHLPVGVLTSLAVAHPTDFRSTVLCVSAAAVGALVCDVDVTRSEAKTKLNQVIGIMVGAAVVAAGANMIFGIDLFSYLRKSSSIFRMLIGFVIFVGICVFGEKTPHRSFMHSAVGVVAVNIAVYTVSPVLVPFFLPAMLSHIAIDLLNKKGVKLLYPLKKGFSLNVCKSSGTVSNVMCLGATVGIVLYLLLFVR